MTELADDGGHGAPRTPVHFRSGGLRKKLLRSFLGLTVFGLVLLFTSLISIFWLRTSTKRARISHDGACLTPHFAMRVIFVPSMPAPAKKPSWPTKKT